MKKIKLLFVAAASIAGVVGAFATTTKLDCLTDPQYKDSIGNPVDPFYRCGNSASTCTWHYVGSTLTPCSFGTYQKLQ